MNTTEQAGSAPAGNPGQTPTGGTPAGAGLSPEPNWTTGLQDADNRAAVAAKGWDKPNTGPDVVISSYRELESRLGKALTIPAADAPQEDWTKLYTALGRPEKPDGYTFKLPEGLPEHLPYDDAFATEFKGWAHAADLSPRQASILHDNFAKRAAKSFQDQQTATTQKVATAHREIQAKWGEEGSVSYKRSLDLAVRAINKLGLAPAYKAAGILTPTGMVTDASIALAMEKVGKELYAEDSVHGGPGALTATNPWKAGQENLQEQGRIAKENPDQARALIIAAGLKPEDVLYTPTR